MISIWLAVRQKLWGNSPLQNRLGLYALSVSIVMAVATHLSIFGMRFFAIAMIVAFSSSLLIVVLGADLFIAWANWTDKALYSVVRGRV